MRPWRAFLLGSSIAAFASTLSVGAAAYDADHVFITNRGGNNVLELDASLNYVKSWFDGAGLSVPNGMAFDPSDRIYVADTGNNRIVVFNAAGAQVTSWDTGALLAPQVESLNFNAAGRLFASANAGNGTVASWKSDGSDPQVFVKDNAYLNLGNVNFSATGNVLLADFSGSHGVRELHPTTGALLKEFGLGTSKHEDMVLDADDNIFVSAFTQNKVLKFDATRTQVGTYSPPGLVQPTGIVLTAACKLLVASFGTDEIFELDYDGSFIKKFKVPGLSLPESLVIAKLSVAGSISIGNPVPKCSGLDAGVGGAGGSGGGGPSGGAAGSGGAGGTSGGSGGVSGSAGASGGTTSGGGAGGGASGGASGSGAAPPKGGTTSGDDGGCGCRTTGRETNDTAFAWLTLLGFAIRLRIADSRH
ncbi:MAG: NHL repeat-containing protein [Myxococcales bacterium]|nr:NHL repeat-containing protein [Myxococcales bacterium]